MNKFVGKSMLFYKYLLSYFVVLLIPIVSIGFLAYSHYISIFENEIIDNNIDSMIRIQNSIEMQMNAIEEIPVRLIYDEKFNHLYLKNNTINILEASKKLNDYVVTNDFLHELVFYVRGYNFMYSSESTYTISTFTSYIYRYLNWDRDEFSYDINHSTSPILRSNEKVIINNQAENNFITYIYPVPGNIRNPYATLICIIDTNPIKRIMSNVIQSDRSNTLILDSNDNIIISLRDDEIIHSSSFQNSLKNIVSYGSRSININGMEYIMCYSNSRMNNWKYVTLVPSEIALSKVINVKTKAIYSTIFLLLIGSIIIYLFMNINYNPIKKLSQTAKDSCNDIPIKVNGIEAAQLAIGYLTQTKNTLNNKIVRNKKAIKEFLLLSLLKGNITNVEEFNEKGKEIGIIMSKPYFSVLIVYLSTLESEQNANNIIEELEKNFPLEIQGYGKNSIEKNKIVFLLSFDKISDSLLESQLLSMQHTIKQKWGLISTIGIGNKFSNIKNIGKSYIQACSAMDYKLIKGENKIIFFNEIIDSSGIDYYPKDQLESLELSILQMNPQKISQIILNIILFNESPRSKLRGI